MGRKKRMGRYYGREKFAIPPEQYERAELEDHYFERVQKSKVLRLSSGDGEVTLEVEFDPSGLSGRDREFIMRLVNAMTEYEKSRADEGFPDLRGTITDDDVPF